MVNIFRKLPLVRGINWSNVSNEFLSAGRDGYLVRIEINPVKP